MSEAAVGGEVGFARASDGVGGGVRRGVCAGLSAASLARVGYVELEDVDVGDVPGDFGLGDVEGFDGAVGGGGDETEAELIGGGGDGFGDRGGEWEWC